MRNFGGHSPPYRLIAVRVFGQSPPSSMRDCGRRCRGALFAPPRTQMRNEIQPTRATTMKTTSRRIFGALLGLCVLPVTVPGVRGDETADWMAEMRRQNDEFNRQAQEDREARDRFNREAQEERDA